MSAITITTNDVVGTKQLAKTIGTSLKGGEVIELVSDVGGGKTTFTKGLAEGLGIDEVVQSPTFTISRLYTAHDGLELHHFDFYRLQEAGVVAAELAESLQQSNVIVVIEWGEIVHKVLPPNRISVSITSLDESKRAFRFTIPKEAAHIKDALNQFTATRNIA